MTTTKPKIKKCCGVKPSGNIMNGSRYYLTCRICCLSSEAFLIPAEVIKEWNRLVTATALLRSNLDWADEFAADDECEVQDD